MVEEEFPCSVCGHPASAHYWKDVETETELELEKYTPRRIYQGLKYEDHERMIIDKCWFGLATKGNYCRCARLDFETVEDWVKLANDLRRQIEELDMNVK